MDDFEDWLGAEDAGMNIERRNIGIHCTPAQASDTVSNQTPKRPK
jgi:hypothetical protein